MTPQQLARKARKILYALLNSFSANERGAENKPKAYRENQVSLEDFLTEYEAENKKLRGIEKPKETKKRFEIVEE